MRRKHILLVSAVTMSLALTITAVLLFQSRVVTADESYYTIGIGGTEGNVENLSSTGGYAVTSNENPIQFAGSNFSFNYKGYFGHTDTNGASFYNVTAITGIKSIYLEHDARWSNTGGCNFTIEYGPDLNYGTTIEKGVISSEFTEEFNDTLPYYFKITMPEMPQYAFVADVTIKRIVITYTC